MTAPLYQSWNPVTQRGTQVTIDSETGLPLILQTQRTQAIVDSAKRIAASFDPHRKREMTHVARIPMVIWQRLARVGITRDPVAFNAWLNSREARQLRTDDGRKL